MLINSLRNVDEIMEAWEDTIGDIGFILENVERELKSDDLSGGERDKLTGLRETLEAVQECY